MTNTIAIDTGDSRSILNLINEMESKDLGMVTGKNDKNEDMLVQLVVDEDAKSLEPYYMQMVINAFKEHDQEIYGDRANYLSEEELKLVEEVEQKERTDITDVKAMALKHMYFVRAES